MGSIPTITDLLTQIRLGSLSSSQLTQKCLDRITDETGEGALAFTAVFSEQALTLASAMDQHFASGAPLAPLHGIPISVKDLFDMGGQVTRAGSTLLKNAKPAASDATIIRRLRQAGAIVIGRTNMTEFAYSGVGLNPHYGTPASPYDRAVRRIPGGSSSGSGVSVTDRMAIASIGTDTGGSVRIPAALCGITGFKPTARRIPTQGVFPLSQTFDSIGPLAPSVQDCILLDQIMSGTPTGKLSPHPINHLRLAVPAGLPLENLDSHVTAAFERALKKLTEAGAHLDEIQVHAFNHPDRPSKGARLLAAEAYAIHRSMLESRMAEFDARVSTRIRPAADTSAADYIDLISWRKDFVQHVEGELQHYDAILMPTTPMIAPPISALEQSDEVYFQTNTLMLRNTCIVNQMDGCAFSIPCHRYGEPPVGLMLAGLAMEDQKIMQIGLAIEKLLQSK